MKQWLFFLIIVPVLSAACQGAELRTTGTPDSVITQTHAARTLADDFAALGAQQAADTAVMLWGIINTLLSGAILRGYPMADAYRIADAFVDLVAPRLPDDQRG